MYDRAYFLAINCAIMATQNCGTSVQTLVVRTTDRQHDNAYNNAEADMTLFGGRLPGCPSRTTLLAASCVIAPLNHYLKHSAYTHASASTARSLNVLYLMSVNGGAFWGHRYGGPVTAMRKRGSLCNLYTDPILPIIQLSHPP